jgi:MFS family permease
MRLIDLLHGWQLFLFVFLVCGSAIPAIMFPITYAILADWWHSEWGRYLMFMGIVVGIALGNTTLRLFVSAAPPWVSVLLWILIFVMTWWCYILFLRTYIKARREKKEKEDVPSD